MPENAVAHLAAELVSIDSRSSVSNLPIAERLEAALTEFEIERLDYVDELSTQKRVLVAHRGPKGGYALAAHMDTVPDTGWTTPPWTPGVKDGVLSGLGSVDMKGPLAACIVAARGAPHDVPVTLLLTTDEETTKAGARVLVERSTMVKALGLEGIVVAEPTAFTPIRGHRSFIEYTAIASGVQAHSASGAGVNANWAMIPFLAEMKGLYERLRADRSLQDTAYDPPYSDFNLILDNHGTAVNVTVPRATARIKFRRSRNVDASSIEAAVQEAAKRTGIALSEKRDGPPPELPEGHPLIRLAVALSGRRASTASYGTDASMLQAIAPCVVMGPGDMSTAHTPRECVGLDELAAAVPLFQKLLAEARV